ncbi:MAG: Nif11-like leader peptide family natural product precursor [Rhizonema sp. PD37]|nr:Nif11-like leader peptide family natural product precursor [Rhizonema sp. PD37]
MSLESVEAFYERLAKDPDFNTQIQSVKSKEECSQIVQAAGYDFTQQEFEEYTTILLDLNPSEGDLRDVDEKELAAVYGGLQAVPLYGVVRPNPEPQPWPPVVKWPPVHPTPPIIRPLYGVVVQTDEIS